MSIVDCQLAQGENMKILIELIYAEIVSIAENISYLRGRCDSIIELCSIHSFSNKNKKYKTKEEKELLKIEKSLMNIRDELNNFAEKIPNRLNIEANEFEKEMLKKKSEYIDSVRISNN